MNIESNFVAKFEAKKQKILNAIEKNREKQAEANREIEKQEQKLEELQKETLAEIIRFHKLDLADIFAVIASQNKEGTKEDEETSL